MEINFFNGEKPFRMERNLLNGEKPFKWRETLLMERNLSIGERNLSIGEKVFNWRETFQLERETFRLEIKFSIGEKPFNWRETFWSVPVEVFALLALLQNRYCENDLFMKHLKSICSITEWNKSYCYCIKFTKGIKFDHFCPNVLFLSWKAGKKTWIHISFGRRMKHVLAEFLHSNHYTDLLSVIATKSIVDINEDIDNIHNKTVNEIHIFIFPSNWVHIISCLLCKFMCFFTPIDKNICHIHHMNTEWFNVHIEYAIASFFCDQMLNHIFHMGTKFFIIRLNMTLQLIL